MESNISLLTFILVFCILSLVIVFQCHNNDANNRITRRLVETSTHSDVMEAKTDFIKTLSHPFDTSQNSEQLLKVTESSLPYPIAITQNKVSSPIHPERHVIVSCALSETYIPNDAVRFLGSARKAGFTGDIVIAILPTAKPAFISKLLSFNATILTMGIKCEGKMQEKCQVLNQASPSKFTFPVSFMRYFFYHTIASKYSTKSLVFISDFRDVIFQTNLFMQRQVQSLLVSQHTDTLMVFQEAAPNKILNRDAQTFGLISQCYGLSGIRAIAHNPVSSSGEVLGHRNAVVTYAFLVIAQSNANQRIQLLQSSGLLPSSDALKSIYDTQQCMSMFGVDQAFHNVLLYQGVLDKYMKVVTMPQGEGPVNNLGGFFGEKKLLRAYLNQWKVLRGQSPYQYVHNWNGEISSVVHQLDRFKESELHPRLEDHIAALQNLEANTTSTNRAIRPKP